ncbi:hypothetical protein [Polaribacter sargassicola]|uniref:hypothetical protein n=1 Tax=Polaribacter sargassicola TaxID=2836891 RepID=UPI001F47CAB9|nr:hypothetical protein [Polaribacter sp. DS7-9]MCG1037142.1 hypothetical protein [Polaribacter sp. DS7-9]
MKFIFKTTILLLSIAILYQSCTDESQVEKVEETQTISADLTEKIIASATFINDYNFFVSNAAKTNCNLLSITSGYFNNPEGDYFSFIFSGTESLNMWHTQYNEAKLQAFNETGVTFSNDDFFISYISNPTGFSGLSKRESMLDYFENCEYGFGDTSEYGLAFSDIPSNCDINTGDVTVFIYDNISGTGGSVDNFTTTSLFSVENLLANYNLQNNTNYDLENLKIYSIPYLTPNGEEVELYETKYLINYFENCMLSRDASINDCLNFVYPLEIKRANLQLNETITIENDEDLLAVFSIQDDELEFVYPINLIDLDGNTIEINTNDSLDAILDDSYNYCQ